MTRSELERIVFRELAKMDPAERVAEALPRRPGARVSVVAIGKAAPAMAAGALRRWSDAVDDVLVVTTDGTAVPIADDPRVTVLRAGHPVPDRRSVRAAKECSTRVRTTDASLVLALVSGGASALVCAPPPGVRLSDKQAVTRAMLASGATVQEINVVRKHLSRIKGGALARDASPRDVMTLVLSDVVGGEIGDVGSGPAVSDASTRREARSLLRRHAPRLAELPLVPTGPAENVIRARVIGSPEELARAVGRVLRARGLHTRVLPASQAPVLDLAREYVALARVSRPGSAIVRAAEPSLEVPRRAGRGGRSTHLAALVGLELPERAMFLAAATDGVDGGSETGGALVDRRLLSRLGDAAVRTALARFDTGPMHRRARTALARRPSGHNLADLHVLVVS